MSLNDAGVDLEIIFQAQYERIARVILGITKDPARAEELAVEVFLRSDRTPYARGEGVEAWLYRSAVRIGLSELRRGTLRGRCERIFGFLARGESVGSTPHEIYAVQEEARQVRLLLSVIEPRQAELLLLRSHDLSYQELAGALNLNPASVGTLLRRVLDAFRKEFINR